MIKKISLALLYCASVTAYAQSFFTDVVLQENVPRLMQQYKVPGVAIGILQLGEVAKYYFYGYADLSSKQKMNESTVFNLGSISKSVTAWGVMRLVEQGKIDLDMPVQQYIKRWQIPASAYNSSGVTVRRLLDHTSGLSQHAVPQFELGEPVPSLDISLSESVNVNGEKARLVSEPGTKWAYSGGGYTLLQLLIEEVSGEPFADFMLREILKPLGMSNSSFEPDEKLIAKLAKSYDHDGNETARLTFAATGAAGLQSTPHDLALFANAALTINDTLVAGRGVLKPETVMLMTSVSSTAKLTNGNPVSRNYGFGYFVIDSEPRFFGHGGDNRGWHSRFIIYLNTQNGFVILTNSSNGFGLAESINCLLAKELTNVDGLECE